MKLEFPASICAPEQVTAVRYELQSYADWMSNDSVRRQTGTVQLEEPSLSDDTIVLLKSWQEGDPISSRSVAELAGYLAKLSLPVIHVMLAATPNKSFREEMAKWFREVGGRDYMVSISINRMIGGGAIIRTPNRYYDYSFAHRVVACRGKLPVLVRAAQARQVVENAN